MEIWRTALGIKLGKGYDSPPEV